MAVSQNGCILLNSTFVAPIPNSFKPRNHVLLLTCKPGGKSNGMGCLTITCSSPKTVASPSLDKHVVKQNRIRFVQKLKTLLLSKPKHYLPLHILSKCRSYLSLSDDRSVRSMIHRYPSIFELFSIPTPPTPFNATKPCFQLCVRLTPAASALAARESDLLSAISLNLAEKLQKLLMLSSHRRLLLSKLVHLAPDLGLPPNFRSRLCNDHPDKFKTVDTSHGRALELVSWNAQLASPMPLPPEVAHGLIVDRPLKFKHLRLRRGLNVKKRHRDFLIRFQELPDVCPYNSSLEEIGKESIEAEKRACALVREVLGLMVEKRTLIDHLTHFRKEFGLPNKLRGMIVRHPELFYVSLKGLRHSVFLVEGYDDKGRLMRRDETLAIKDQLMELVRESKRIRRERRKSHKQGVNVVVSAGVVQNELDDIDDEYDDGFEDIFESEDSSFDYFFDTDNNECYEVGAFGDSIEFWNSNASINRDNEEGGSRDAW
uniref:Uncharacterized protein MANES_02G208600 n=1 Tax=Rhizophora mucronata TaxID=61149 RepID=A0A2P2NI29_RHIMU